MLKEIEFKEDNNQIMDRTRTDVESIIEELKRGHLMIKDVPEEVAFDINIVKAERTFGIRKSGFRGFDVIKQEFFVEEEWLYKNSLNETVVEQHKVMFDNFKQYYYYLDGDIYEDACYYQYKFGDDFSKTLDLDINRLKEKKSFRTDTVDDYVYELSDEERENYLYHEKTVKRFCKQWIKKFNDCDTHEKLKKVCSNYEKSVMGKYKGVDFFLEQYAFQYESDQEHLQALLEFLSKDCSANLKRFQTLCLLFDYRAVVENADFSNYSISTNRKYKRELRKFILELEKGDVVKEVKGFFDKNTHYFCEKTIIHRYTYERGKKIIDSWNDVEVCRAFETFDEFIKYRNGNLKNCDLSDAIDLDVNLFKYQIDSKTELPILSEENLEYKITKAYNSGRFKVMQFWSDKEGKIIKEYSHWFEYFFDFVAFLKGDLSNADLLFCDGIQNLIDIGAIDLKNARLTSVACELFGISFNMFEYDRNLVGEFKSVLDSEEKTEVVLNSSRTEDLDGDRYLSDIKISYISDLHLLHKIKNKGCKSKEDVEYLIQKIVDNIVNEGSTITLIGGDVSSDISIFELFVKLLRKTAGDYSGRQFIFVLGNHELWNFSDSTFLQIVERYKKIVKKYDMYLLQNELYYMNELDETGIISYNEVVELDNETIQNKLKCSRVVIFGGLGFSGYNEKLNANHGVYRKTIDREKEIQESKKIENLYNKLLEVLDYKNTIIFTHTPIQDWCMKEEYHEKFVYVSGHTHRNQFFDDGIRRIYADNQSGYCNENIHLKYFLIEYNYDYFKDYKDGIYQITSQEYQDFARGKNMGMTFNRHINVLYMLKKNKYYCFIHKTQKGILQLLNGGALKNLNIKDIQFYYDNMDMMIDSIEKPLYNYTEYLKKIANEIKKIGGYGYIHGCIIDIDYFNHIYVNPIDLTVVGYYALDMIYKTVYPSIPALLKDNCPMLYSSYEKLIEGNKTNLLVSQKKELNSILLPQVYLETDIYKASREIKKMQKLEFNVLTTWYDIFLDTKQLM